MGEGSSTTDAIVGIYSSRYLTDYPEVVDEYQTYLLRTKDDDNAILDTSDVDVWMWGGHRQVLASQGRSGFDCNNYDRGSKVSQEGSYRYCRYRFRIGFLGPPRRGLSLYYRRLVLPLELFIFRIFVMAGIHGAYLYS